MKIYVETDELYPTYQFTTDKQSASSFADELEISEETFNEWVEIEGKYLTMTAKIYLLIRDKHAT